MARKKYRKTIFAAAMAAVCTAVPLFATACASNDDATATPQKPAGPSQPANPNQPQTPNQPSTPDPIFLNKVASFDTGFSNADGGVAEIVQYNRDNKKFYLVNGQTKTVDIVTLRKYNNTDELETVFDEQNDRLYFDEYVTDHQSDFASGFAVGDITSVAINTDRDEIAVAVQNADNNAGGAIVLLNYDGSYKAAYGCGVQPDMITYAGNIVLTADEGEPRAGYGEGTTDPKGSVTILDLSAQTPTPAIVTFDKFDATRDQLIADKVLLKKDTAPSVDLEPEYIAVNGNYAYVSLQEANAIATLDISKKEFISVKGLGFKDHNADGNEIDIIDDGKAELKKQPDFLGVYMPDGIDVFAAGGKTYIVTANEGDAREWGSGANAYSGIDKYEVVAGNKVEVLKNSEFDGLQSDKHYLLGGRSFAIFDASDMSLVYDSGNSIESKIAASEEYKNYFNCNSTAIAVDGRSKKKGPEPETVKVITENGKRYVFVALERQGGVMMFDITDTSKVEYVAYANSRDYSEAMKGDVAPEGLCYVPASDSPNGKKLLMAANENSGTVSVYAMESSKTSYTMHEIFTQAPQPEIPSTADHLLIWEVYGDGGATDAYASHGFIVLHNPTDSAIDLTGYKVKYSTAAKAETPVWSELALSGTLPAKGYYVIRCKAATVISSGAVISLSDDDRNIDWDLAIDNKQYTVDIRNADDQVIDRLGVKDKTDVVEFEGTAFTGTSKKKLAIRKSAVDTDDNSADFTIVDFSAFTADQAAPYKFTPAGTGAGTSSSAALAN